MTHHGSEIERYVEEVLEELPPAATGRDGIESDLRAHLNEAAEASGSGERAVREMGPAAETAEGYARGLDLTPARLADRTGAFLVDLGLGALLSAVIFAVATDVEAGASGWGTAMTVVVAAVAGALALLYFPALETRYGQTLGKRLFGLCVAREDGLRAELWRTVVRRLPLFFEFFWLDALFAPFTAKSQRAFDLVAGTIVVPGETWRATWSGRGTGWILALLLWTVSAAAVATLGG